MAEKVRWPERRTEYPSFRRVPLTGDERYCLDMTRREAGNFYWGFIALPREQRIAIYGLYSFAREVDDSIDLAQDPAPLDAHRDRLTHCYTGRASDPVMRVLTEVVTRYGIPRPELEALIDGVEMDLKVKRYESWPQLQSYCELVASSIGRMCVRIFGYRDPQALDLATDLGVAMQLSNILRDVREDFELGRVYLPQEELRQFGIAETALAAGRRGAEWEALVRHEIGRAHALFSTGLQVTEMIPRRAAVCVLTMAGIYQEIVSDIERDPFLPLQRRASLSGRRKLEVMLRSCLRAV